MGHLLTDIAAWFIEQPPAAKKMYITTVMAIDAVYMLRVEPMRRNLQPFESLFSILSRQYSAQVWARSTSKIRPRRTNNIAPAKAKYEPQTWKKVSGMKKVMTTKNSHIRTFGPQKPFWSAARPSLVDLTPSRSIARMKWKRPRAKLTRCTATHP